MKKIKVYFCEIIDLNYKKHQIKTDDEIKILSFMRQHKGKIAGIKKGSRLVSEEKLLELQKDENFR